MKKFLEQLGVDQVHLAEVWLRWVGRDARAVLHGGTEVRIALHPHPGDQLERRLGRLREAVVRAAVKVSDNAEHNTTLPHPPDRHGSIPSDRRDLRPALQRSQASERSKRLHDREQPPHEPLHATSGADLEQEACLVRAGIAHDMHLPTMNVRCLPDPEPTFLAPHSHGQGPGQNLDPLVLASMDVTRDPTPRIEPHLYLEQLARGFAAGLQEGQVLASQRIVKMFALCHDAPYLPPEQRLRLDATPALPPSIVGASLADYGRVGQRRGSDARTSWRTRAADHARATRSFVRC